MKAICKYLLGPQERVSGIHVLMLAAIMAVVLYFCFRMNEDCLLLDLDGTVSLIQNRLQSNRRPFSQSGVDPVQGMFDAYPQTRREYLLPVSAAILLTQSLPDKPVTYLLFGLLVAGGIYALGRAIPLERPVALLGAFLFPTLAFPAFFHLNSQLYGLFQLNIYLAQAVALSALIVASFWGMDGQSTGWRIAIISAPALCVALAIVAYPPEVALMAPATAFYSVGSLLTAGLKRNRHRVIAAILTLVAPIAMGSLEYYRSLVGYTAYSFFQSEFMQVPPERIYISAFNWVSPFGSWTIVLGVVGAVWLVFTGSSRTRTYGIVHLLATAIYMPLAYWLVFVTESYRGPMPVYFETFMWPHSLLLSAAAIVGAMHSSARALMLPFLGRSSWSGRIAVWTVLLCVVSGVLVFNAVAVASKGHEKERCPSQAFYPISGTPITDFLEKKVGLATGRAFRGLVATITGVDGKSSRTWVDLVRVDRRIWNEVGNDHRTAGLWNFNIPTLFQYSPTMTPFFYRFVKEFLSRPEDVQLRNIAIITKVNQPIMRLWGVRYLITDFPTEAGTRILEVSVGTMAPLELRELNGANLGDYSPTEVKQLSDVRSAFSALKAPDFNARQTVFTVRNIEGPFVPANNVRMSYSADGFRVEAESKSSSLLVLPVQFSNCWKATTTSKATLFRANVLQLGIKFEGHLDAELKFRYGPLGAGKCRSLDLWDAKRLRLGESP